MTLLVDPPSLTVEPRRWVCDVCEDRIPEVCFCAGDRCRCGIAWGPCPACGSELIEEPEEE